MPSFPSFEVRRKRMRSWKSGLAPAGPGLTRYELSGDQTRLPRRHAKETLASGHSAGEEVNIVELGQQKARPRLGTRPACDRAFCFGARRAISRSTSLGGDTGWTPAVLKQPRSTGSSSPTAAAVLIRGARVRRLCRVRGESGGSRLESQVRQTTRVIPARRAVQPCGGFYPALTRRQSSHRQRRISPTRRYRGSQKDCKTTISNYTHRRREVAASEVNRGIVPRCHPLVVNDASEQIAQRLFPAQWTITVALRHVVAPSISPSTRGFSKCARARLRFLRF
jgi:hypothetical protein